MPTKIQCSQKVSDNDKYGVYSHQCPRNATVTGADGKHYCGQHDPERRTRRLAATCQYKEERYMPLCGKPAVEVDKYGYGCCAEHTEKHLAYVGRLEKAAPELLAILKGALELLAPSIKQQSNGLLLTTLAIELSKAQPIIAKIEKDIP